MGAKGASSRRGKKPKGRADDGGVDLSAPEGGVFAKFDEEALDRAQASRAALGAGAAGGGDRDDGGDERAAGSSGEDDARDALPAVDPLTQLMSSFARERGRKRARAPTAARAEQQPPPPEAAAGAGAAEADRAAASAELVSEEGADAAAGASDERYERRFCAPWEEPGRIAAARGTPDGGGGAEPGGAAAPVARWSAALGECSLHGTREAPAEGGPPPLRAIDELVLPDVAARWRASRPGRAQLTRAQAELGGWLRAGHDVELADLHGTLGGVGCYERMRDELVPLLCAYAADHVTRPRRRVLANTEAVERRARARAASAQGGARAPRAGGGGGGGAAGAAASDSESGEAAGGAAPARAPAPSAPDPDSDAESDGARDQGFSRARVLLLLPFRQDALAAAEAIAALLPAHGGGAGRKGRRPKDGGAGVEGVSVLKAERLRAEFGADDDDAAGADADGAAAAAGADGDDELEAAAAAAAAAGVALSKKQARALERRRAAREAPRPLDYVSLFGGARAVRADGSVSGARARARNCDDCFVLGLRLSRRALRPYAPAGRADILLASPLGVWRELLGDGAGPGPASAALSSIELALLWPACCLAMQNWAHVHAALGACNRVPSVVGETDFGRVHRYCLEGLGRHVRQTVLLAEHASADASALMRVRCASVGGLVRVRAPPGAGHIRAALSPALRFVFSRFGARTPAEVADARFNAFVEQVLPLLEDRLGTRGAGTLVLVPSYFDWVRLRNRLRAADLELAELSEYAAARDAARLRAAFARGDKRVLLTTERAHFFSRTPVRGVRHVCFYGLPLFAHFFAEVANLIRAAHAGAPDGAAPGGGGGGGSHTVLSLFCAYDALQLQRAVGPARAAEMLEGEQRTYLFC